MPQPIQHSPEVTAYLAEIGRSKQAGLRAGFRRTIDMLHPELSDEEREQMAEQARVEHLRRIARNGTPARMARQAAAAARNA